MENKFKKETIIRILEKKAEKARKMDNWNKYARLQRIKIEFSERIK